MGTPSISTLSTLALDAIDAAVIGDFDTNSLHLEYESESIRMVQQHTSTTAIRGTRSKPSTRVNVSQEAIGGSISLYPTTTELGALLVYILGLGSGIGAAGAGTYSVTETLPIFSLLIDRKAQRHIYQGCKIARATISCSQSQPMMLTLDILGLTEVLTATATPTLTAIDASDPYMMYEMTYTNNIDASATECREFSIVIDNGLDGGRFLNSLTRTQIPETDRTITGSLVVPYTADEISLYDTSVAGGTLTITLNNGSMSAAFAFANIKIPAESPVSGSRGSEIVQGLNFQAYETASVKELIVTLA